MTLFPAPKDRMQLVVGVGMGHAGAELEVLAYCRPESIVVG